MAKQIKEEYKIFMRDVEKNFKNKEDLEYIRQRIPKLMDKVINELNNIEFKLKEKEEDIQEIMDKQEKMESKVERIQKVLNNIENDIYADEGFDFEIVCPYCNNDFIIDVDENSTEVKCPECNNIIELDWSGNVEGEWDMEDYEDYEDYEGCDGSCSECPGCDDVEFGEEEDDDM